MSKGKVSLYFDDLLSLMGPNNNIYFIAIYYHSICWCRIVKNNIIYYYNSESLIFNKAWSMNKQMIFLSTIKKNYNYKLILIGLGYKYFVYKKHLYILIGFSHYIYIKIPHNILLYCRKKKLFMQGTDKQQINSFSAKIKYFKSANVYKGKGIIEFKSFKNFIKLKKGKK